MTTNPIENHTSYGGVVYTTENTSTNIVVCGRKLESSWMWGLPKGTPANNETNHETAMREVTEETGLKVSIQSSIGSINYSFVRSLDAAICHKIVHFYLMNPTGGSIEDHDNEFDEVKWVNYEESIQMLTHQNEVNIVNQAMDIICREI